ncbi:MAG: efflux RND transporter permease subunit [Rhodospirillales bacterium]|nr:efflux RND transporter permease subunit [Rhodospirillales bacterium]
MFAFLVNASLRNRLFVLAAASILVIFGALTLRKLPIDVFPDLNRPTVTIMTEAEGLAPEEVEILVSFHIETMMNGMPGVMRVRSVSAIGLSIVFVEFGWNTNIYIARQLVMERLALVRARLPANMNPTIGPISSIMGEIMLIALSGDGVNPMAMREFADWVMRPRLLTIPGVSQVIPIGGEVREYRVKPDPVALRRLDIKVEDIENALRGFGANTGGGFIDQQAREFLIRNIGRTTQIEDLKRMVVGVFNRQPIELRQVALVDFAPRVKRGDAGFMSKPAVIISVQKQPNADTVVVTRAVEAALAELAGGAPPGIKIDNILVRQADFIETSVANVKSVLMEAVVVVAIILFLFLLSTRTTLISLTAIPISILITVLVFEAMGLSINTMTLGGLAIAIGELVDDAVVDVENILRRLRQNRERGNPLSVLKVVAGASQEVRSGIVYATAIVIMVFIPLFALSGIEGRLFAPLGIAYIVSILASLVTSITVTPVLCYILLPRMKRLDQHDGFLVRWLKGINGRVVDWALDHPRPILTTAVVSVAIAMTSLLLLPRSFLPPFNEGTLTIIVASEPGISLAESNRVGTLAERLVMQVPEVVSVGRRTGRAELDEHAEGIHNGELEVSLRHSERSRDEILRDIRYRLAILPVSLNVGQPISHRLDHMLSGVRAEIALKIFGDDLDTLRGLAGTFQEKLARIPGITDLSIEKQVRIPQLQARVDYRRAALFGATPGTVTDALQSLANGRVVSEVVDGTRRFNVVLRLSDTDRTLGGLQGLWVETPTGRVPLTSFAAIESTDGPNQILRENSRRRIVVMANSDGAADRGNVVSAIRDEIARTPLPTGYSVSLEGTFQAQEEAALLISALSLISLSLIFVVLYSRYRSTALTLIIMGNVPLALIGGVAALWIAGQTLSVPSMVGFITLMGITTRNGILKVSHYLNLAVYEGETFGKSLIIRGSQERLSPVLMTALCAGFAMIPLLYNADQPGREILHPVAVVIFGGLITATTLDTVITPILFRLFGEKPLQRHLAERESGKPAIAF